MKQNAAGITQTETGQCQAGVGARLERRCQCAQVVQASHTKREFVAEKVIAYTSQLAWRQRKRAQQLTAGIIEQVLRQIHRGVADVNRRRMGCQAAAGKHGGHEQGFQEFFHTFHQDDCNRLKPAAGWKHKRGCQSTRQDSSRLLATACHEAQQAQARQQHRIRTWLRYGRHQAAVRTESRARV